MTYFADGIEGPSKTGIAEKDVVQAGGKLYVGLLQGSYGGGFDGKKAFQGYMSNLHIWERVLTNKEINDMAKSCNVIPLAVIANWSHIVTHKHGDVTVRHENCYV